LFDAAKAQSSFLFHPVSFFLFYVQTHEVQLFLEAWLPVYEAFVPRTCLMMSSFCRAGGVVLIAKCI
jgi:hypothetical protein